jgi:hypothetical protein
VEGLCSLAQERPSINSIKEMIVAINAKDPKKDDLVSLAGVNFLPILRSGSSQGGIHFRNCQSNFGIIDRAKTAEIFKDRTGLLAFSLEEVRNLEPFLRALDLGNKYLSCLCTEMTACSDNGVLDIVRTEKFRDRAYYLLR